MLERFRRAGYVSLTLTAAPDVVELAGDVVPPARGWIGSTTPHPRGDDGERGDRDSDGDQYDDVALFELRDRENGFAEAQEHSPRVTT